MQSQNYTQFPFLVGMAVPYSSIWQHEQGGLGLAALTQLGLSFCPHCLNTENFTGMPVGLVTLSWGSLTSSFVQVPWIVSGLLTEHIQGLDVKISPVTLVDSNLLDEEKLF